MIVAGTGHRPPRLGLGYAKDDRAKLAAFAKARLLAMGGVTRVISGGAQGWDQALAHAAAVLKIPFVVAVPFAGQESKWPLDAREYFGRLLARAAEVVIVSEGGYAAAKFIKRDHWMVDRADALLALWDGEPAGGTYATVKYAGEQGKRVDNVWPAWLAG